jgi:hypothetical protein
MIPKFKNQIFKKKNGVNRDAEGRFAHGSGGLVNISKFNYRRAAPLITVILLVGGLLVYESMASTRSTWTPDSGGARVSTSVSKATDSEGLPYWKFEIPASISTVSSGTSKKSKYKRAGSIRVTDKIKGSVEYCTNIKNSTGKIRVKWGGASAKYSGKSSGDGFVVNGKTLYINEPIHQDFCVNADNKSGNLTIVIDYLNTPGTASTQVAVYKISKIQTSPNHNNQAPPNNETNNSGMVGFTWTQDNIIIPSKSKSQVANIHMYGWGSLWPFVGDAPRFEEADSGETIGSRIEKSSQDGQEIMITTCCAPSTFNTTGIAWDLDRSRVREDKEQLYADRVAELVSKYPQIKYIQVWNEFKGYWDGIRNTWDAESYTRFYNKVYKAVKAKRSSVKVSGGYLVFSANITTSYNALFNDVNIDKRSVNALQYWLDNADGYDAISLDAFLAPKDFPKIMEYVRTMRGAKGKPIWWAEFYNNPGTSYSIESAQSPYIVAKEIVPNMKQGDIALYWAERKFTPDINKPLW